MPRLPQLPRAIATGLSLALLASCAGSGNPPSSAADTGAQKAEDAVSQEVVVTGAHVVTGARVKRREPAAAPPITMIGTPSPALALTRNAYAPSRIEPWPGRPYYRDTGRDKFTATEQNAFKIVRDEPVSTFSLDVDTASYSFVRASLNQNVLPQPAAVRTEELVNYFPYDYAPARAADQPFSTHVAVFPSPWAPGRQLVRIGVKGFEIGQATRPRANLVFLIDTSGSMNAPNKLPLVKQSLAMLLDQLDGNDSVAIVTYAGTAGTVLEPTSASRKDRILAALDRLGAGGSTAGAEGIRQAYALAAQNFDLLFTKPDDLDTFLKAEMSKWGRIIKEAGIIEE